MAAPVLLLVKKVTVSAVVVVVVVVAVVDLWREKGFRARVRRECKKAVVL